MLKSTPPTRAGTPFQSNPVRKSLLKSTPPTRAGTIVFDYLCLFLVLKSTPPTRAGTCLGAAVIPPLLRLNPPRPHGRGL